MREIIATTPEHIAELAVTMRQKDVDEVWASHHSSPLAALERGVKMSEEPFTGLKGGEVVCIFGVSTSSPLSEEGCPWLLASDILHDDPATTFLRVNKVYVREIKKRYSKLVNYIDCRNEAGIRWIKWLGFELDEPAPYGLDGLPFHRFQCRRG